MKCSTCKDRGTVRVQDKALKAALGARYLDGLDDRSAPCPDCQAQDKYPEEDE